MNKKLIKWARFIIVLLLFIFAPALIGWLGEMIRPICSDDPNFFQYWFLGLLYGFGCIIAVAFVGIIGLAIWGIANDDL